MKNVMLFSFFIFAFSTSIFAQKNERVPLTKGEQYHIVVGNKIIQTKDIFSAAEKYEGKIKAILQFKAPQKKEYHLSKEAALFFRDLDPIKIDRDTPHPLACHCVLNTVGSPVFVRIRCLGDCHICCEHYKKILEMESTMETLTHDRIDRQ